MFNYEAFALKPFRPRFGENSQFFLGFKVRYAGPIFRTFLPFWTLVSAEKWRFLPRFGTRFSCYVFQGFVLHQPNAIHCEFGLVLRSFCLRQSFTPSGSPGCGGSLFQLWIWTRPLLLQAASLLQAVLRESNKTPEIQTLQNNLGNPAVRLENPAFWDGLCSTWRWKIQQNPRQSRKTLGKSSILRWTLLRAPTNTFPPKSHALRFPRVWFRTKLLWHTLNWWAIFSQKCHLFSLFYTKKRPNLQPPFGWLQIMFLCFLVCPSLPFLP